jgi:hypothetical protein
MWEIMKKKLLLKISDAEFLGWQKNHLGDSFALYNITNKDHPSYGSTVSEYTINKLNLKMPEQVKSENRKNNSGISGNETKTTK